MAEMLAWAAAGAFCLVGYGMGHRLGLFDEVPRDPKARVASYSSAVMLVFKDQLFSAHLEAWSPQSIQYVKENKTGLLWVENGALHCRHGAEKGSFPIGDLGNLRFSLDGHDLSMEIFAAETNGAEHSAQISVRVLKYA